MSSNSASKSKSKKFVPQKGISVHKVTPLPVTTGSGKTPEKIKIVSWNVNGIRNAINKYLIRDLLVKAKPDILCINETKINQDQIEKQHIELNGFHSYWNFCKISAGYSGVAVFTKFLPISVEEDILQPEHSQQGRVLTLEFQLFYLIVVSAPFAGLALERLHYKTQLYEPAFYRHCERVKDKGKGVFICGDLNTAVDYKDTHFTAYTIKNPGFTKLQRKNLKIFMQLGWIDTFRHLNPEVKKFTWWNLKHNGRQLKIGKRFDYCLVNTSFKEVVVSSDIIEQLMATDHSPIKVKVDLSLRKVEDDLKNYSNLFWLKNSKNNQVDTSQAKQDQQSIKECKQQAREVGCNEVGQKLE